jgi:hypothetical protein
VISYKSIKIFFIFLVLLSVGCTYTLTGVDNKPISTYKVKEQGYEKVFIDDKLSEDYDEIIVQYFPCNDNYLRASDSVLLSYLDRDPCFLYRVIPNQVSKYLRERNIFKTIVVTDEIDSVYSRQLILKARLNRLLLQNKRDRISSHTDIVDITYEIEGELVDAITGRLIAKFKHIRSLPLQKRMLNEGIIASGDIVAEDIARFIMRIY